MAGKKNDENPFGQNEEEEGMFHETMLGDRNLGVSADLNQQNPTQIINNPEDLESLKSMVHPKL